MKRQCLWVAAWLVFVVSRPVQAGSFDLNGHHFVLPDGFEVEVVAAPPLVGRPISASLDEQGRLYVTESSGSNDNVQKQLQEKPHRVLRLEDTDGDGRFDRRVVFAEKMMFPEGALWYDGSLYVAAPPSIWKLTDTDGDGVADLREEWFEGKTLTGCANDLHGPYIGPDGWIYWCKGAFAKQTYERPGKPPFVTRAAHIFRRRPEGGTIEPVMTGGMDNPVEVVFTPGGERIFTTTFFQHPGGGQRDGLIHAIYGGVYGKIHDVIDEHKRTGDVMPVLTHFGAAAPCGLERLESDQFGREYQDNLFAALFNLHKVTRHVLRPTGATFQTQDEDFLVSDNIDFHPTDVIEDADGSLIVVDTGGWYKLCCPTSQLWKPDVLGAIYRVRRTGAHQVRDPRGLTLDWSGMSDVGLASMLSDSRPAVRKRAAAVLSSRGVTSVPALASAATNATDPRARIAAIWTLTRIDDDKARAAVRVALDDDDSQVRQAAIHSASVHRDAEATGRLIELLASDSLHNRRAAAEALGRIGNERAVTALLAAAGDDNDRVLEHSLTFALIEIADPRATAVGLDAASPRTRRAALIALDQMDGGGLKPDQIEPLLISKNSLLHETANWILNRNPQWGPSLIEFYRGRLSASQLTESEHDELREQLARLSQNTEIQELLAAVARDEMTSRKTKLTVVEAMSRSGLKTLPSSWTAELVRLLDDSDEPLIRAAVTAARAAAPDEANVDSLRGALFRVARNGTLPDEIRLEALAAVPGGCDRLDPDLYDWLRSHLPADNPVRNRSLAAEIIAHAKLTKDQYEALVESLPDVSPLELDTLLTVFKAERDEPLGLQLVAALRRSPATAGLNPETLRSRLEPFSFSDAVRTDVQRLCASLAADEKKQKAMLLELLDSVHEGDVRRGQQVFNSPQAACASCHAIGYLGGNIGPDLTRIARIRSDRDLAEAILYPSASFVRSYEPLTVITKQGQIHNGVVRKENADEIVLALDAEKEVHIARQDIDETQPGKVSVMPAGLDKQLTRQQLSDLLAFLKSTK